MCIDAREHDRVAPGEAQLPVGPPREGVEPAVAPEPAPRHEAVRDVAGGRGEHVEQRLRRHLVVVDPEDPVAARLLVSQRSVRSTGSAYGYADDASASARDGRDARIDPIVDGDHDLAGDGPEHRRSCGKPARNTAQAADGEHAPTIRVRRVASRGCEDRPLRRRGPPPAARDPAGEGARAAGRSPSTATPTRSGSREADIAKVVDFSDAEAVLKAVAATSSTAS